MIRNNNTRSGLSVYSMKCSTLNFASNARMLNFEKGRQKKGEKLPSLPFPLLRRL